MADCHCGAYYGDQYYKCHFGNIIRFYHGGEIIEVMGTCQCECHKEEEKWNTANIAEKNGAKDTI